MVYSYNFCSSNCLTLFSCSCSDLESLAALSSPSAKDFFYYFCFIGFGFGRDIFEKEQRILLERLNNILVVINYQSIIHLFKYNIMHSWITLLQSISIQTFGIVKFILISFIFPFFDKIFMILMVVLGWWWEMDILRSFELFELIN